MPEKPINTFLKTPAKTGENRTSLSSTNRDLHGRRQSMPLTLTGVSLAAESEPGFPNARLGMNESGTSGPFEGDFIVEDSVASMSSDGYVILR